MFKSLTIRGLALALVALAALGTMSALAGAGPAGHVADVVTGGDDEASPAVHETNGDVQGTEMIADAIAMEFAETLGLSEEQVMADVLALHDDGIGFGAIYKLYQLAVAMDITVGGPEDLLALVPTNEAGEPAFGFGKLFKALTQEEMDRLDGLHKNLGQAVSSSHHETSGGEVATSETEPAGGSSNGKGHGPPPFAKAHGHQ